MGTCVPSKTAERIAGGAEEPRLSPVQPALSQEGGPDRRHRNVRAARDLETLLVPRLLRIRCALQPATRSRDHLVRRRDLVHDTELERLGRFQAVALEQQRQGLLDADEARQTLCATGAWEQPDLDLGQSDLGLRIVGQYPVVAREADLEPTTEGHAVGRSHGLAAGLETSEQLRQAGVFGSTRLHR